MKPSPHPNLLAFGSTLLLLAPMVSGASESPQVELVAEGLRAPAAVAVRPGKRAARTQVFVVEPQAVSVALWDAAANAIVRPLTTSPDKAPGALPTTLTFLTADSLAIAWQQPAGEFAGIGVYEVSSRGSLRQTAFRQAGEQAASLRGGPLLSLIHNDRYLYACGGNPAQPALARARHNSGMLGELRDVARLRTGGPSIVGFNPQGYLVATTNGRLSFFNPAAISNGARLELDTGLPGMLDFAYSPLPRPAQRQLYAAAPGGVFRLDATLDPHDKLACHATPIAQLERPAAMAFSATGTLYVAAQGDAPEAGRLYAVTGEL